MEKTFYSFFYEQTVLNLAAFNIKHDWFVLSLCPSNDNKQILLVGSCVRCQTCFQENLNLAH